jgi:hypothetical protein
MGGLAGILQKIAKITLRIDLPPRRPRPGPESHFSGCTPGRRIDSTSLDATGATDGAAITPESGQWADWLVSYIKLQ